MKLEDKKLEEAADKNRRALRIADQVEAESAKLRRAYERLTERIREDQKKQ